MKWAFETQNSSPVLVAHGNVILTNGTIRSKLGDVTTTEIFRTDGYYLYQNMTTVPFMETVCQSPVSGRLVVEWAPEFPLEIQAGIFRGNAYYRDAVIVLVDGSTVKTAQDAECYGWRVMAMFSKFDGVPVLGIVCPDEIAIEAGGNVDRVCGPHMIGRPNFVCVSTLEMEWNRDHETFRRWIKRVLQRDNAALQGRL